MLPSLLMLVFKYFVSFLFYVINVSYFEICTCMHEHILCAACLYTIRLHSVVLCMCVTFSVLKNLLCVTGLFII